MFTPKIEHIALTVKDLVTSKDFYTQLFVLGLGCKIIEETDTFLAIDFNGGFLFELWQEHKEFEQFNFNRYQVGLHHFAIELNNKAMVDSIYQKLLSMKVVILDPPQYYHKYAPNYYAVYYQDPNGFKMEFMTTN